MVGVRERRGIATGSWGEGQGREMVSHNTALVSAGGITVAGPVLRMNIISFEGVGSDILCLGRESSSGVCEEGCYECVIIIIIIIIGLLSLSPSL